MAKILEQLKMMKLKAFLYPSLLGIFILIAGILFILSATFISKEINKIFSVNEDNDKSLKIDNANYVLVAQKLNLPINTGTADSSSDDTLQESSSTSTENIQPAIDKKTLKIEILNGSGISGLAADLKKSIAAADFIVEKTGNSDSIQKITEIQVKEGVQKYAAIVDEIKNIVSAKYAPGDIQTLNASSSYDIIIIIGTK